MKYSREILWHFTCEECKGWWSFASSDDWHPLSASVSQFYCPHCGENQVRNDDIGYTGIM